MSGAGARVGRLGWLADYPVLLAQWHPTRPANEDARRYHNTISHIGVQVQP